MTMITETQSVTGSAGSFLASLGAVLEAMTASMRLRMTLNALAELDDHQLKDIGLTRDDLIDLRLASSANVLDTLGRIRRNR